MTPRRDLYSEIMNLPWHIVLLASLLVFSLCDTYFPDSMLTTVSMLIFVGVTFFVLFIWPSTSEK